MEKYLIPNMDSVYHSTIYLVCIPRNGLASEEIHYDPGNPTMYKLSAESQPSLLLSQLQFHSFNLIKRGISAWNSNLITGGVSTCSQNIFTP